MMTPPLRWPSASRFTSSPPLPPVLWSPGERARLARLHERFCRHRDLLTPAEVQRAMFCRYLLLMRRMERG